MNRFLLSLLAALLLIPSFVSAKDPLRTIEGVVSKVSDGDIVQITDKLGTKVIVRLYGIDAPETPKGNKMTGHISKQGQPNGKESHQALKAKIFKKNIKLEILDIDKYKRSVGILYLDGKNINHAMVAEGHAWAYRKYLDRPHASEYIRAEARARVNRLGLWKQDNPQPPWEFRKNLNKGNHSSRDW